MSAYVHQLWLLCPFACLLACLLFRVSPLRILRPESRLSWFLLGALVVTNSVIAACRWDTEIWGAPPLEIGSLALLCFLVARTIHLVVGSTTRQSTKLPAIDPAEGPEDR